MTAAISYLEAGGESRFIGPLKEHFGETVLSAIDQAAIDAAAVTLYPAESAATRNRQVYTPVSAILKHAGREKALKRPKGWRGEKRTHWLKPPQAFAVLEAAAARNARFGAMLTFMLYTGCRLGETLRLRVADVDLSSGFAFLGKTKNGEPRAVHLPPIVVTAIANLRLDTADPDQSVFGFVKGLLIREILIGACADAGVSLPPRVAFHVFRHCYGAWMRRYGNLDTSGLVATGAWLSHEAARVYEHVEVSEEARKADLLPTPEAWKIRGNGAK